MVSTRYKPRKQNRTSPILLEDFVDDGPYYIGPISEANDTVWRPHHCVFIINDNDFINFDREEQTEIYIERIKPSISRSMSIIQALWGPGFIQDWAIVFASMHQLKDFQMLMGPATRNQFDAGMPVLWWSQQLYPFVEVTAGRVALSHKAREIECAIAACIYKLDRVFTYAIEALNLYGNHGAIDAEVLRILRPKLLLINQNRQRRGLTADDREAAVHDYFCHELGPQKTRDLYNEKSTSTSPEITCEWQEIGQSVARDYPAFAQIGFDINTILELRSSFSLLDNLILMFAFAQTFESEVARTFRPGGAASKQVKIDREQFLTGEDFDLGAGLPNFEEATQIALEFNINPSALLPHLFHFSPHFLAAQAIGRHKRWKDLYLPDTETVWGIRGLSVAENDGALTSEYAAIRESLRNQLPPELAEEAKRIFAGQLSESDRAAVREFRGEGAFFGQAISVLRNLD